MSVRRYEKHAALLRQIAWLGRQRQQLCEQAARLMPLTLVRALETRARRRPQAPPEADTGYGKKRVS